MSFTVRSTRSSSYFDKNRLAWIEERGDTIYFVFGYEYWIHSYTTPTKDYLFYEKVWSRGHIPLAVKSLIDDWFDEKIFS